MDTFIQLPTGQLVNKRYADEKVLSALSSGLYKEVDSEGVPILSGTPTETKAPIGSISTTSAAQTLQQKVDKLNTYSPSTTPGYVPPKTEPTETKVDSKAYFANDAGQEAEYTQDQLNDPSIKDYIQKGGYVMTKTEGPTALASEISVIDKQIADLANIFNTYSPEQDQTFVSQAQGIRSQYDELRNEIKEAEELYKRSIGTSMQRYTPVAAASLGFTIATEATKALGSVLRKEQSAVAEARSAYQSGRFTQFNNMLNTLEKIRDKKAATLEKINTNFEKAIEEQRKETKRMNMESDIVSLMGEGITDVMEISKQLGFKYSSKDIKDSLKNLAPETKDWKDKLSGTTRDFYVLQGQGLLPGNIASLPENQQLFAYLKAEKLASSIGSGAGSKNKITLAEAKSLGLPISTVGMSQDDILKTLQADAAPPWFIEKVQNELQMSLTPQAAKDAWNEFRNEVMSTAEGDEPEKEEEPSNEFEKARQYFEATYEGLDDDQLDQIATQVETYVNGGMSYADAVAETIKDLE